MAEPRSFREEKTYKGFLVFDAVTAREKDFLRNLFSMHIQRDLFDCADMVEHPLAGGQLIWRQNRVVFREKHGGSSTRIRLAEF